MERGLPSRASLGRSWAPQLVLRCFISVVIFSLLWTEAQSGIVAHGNILIAPVAANAKSPGPPMARFRTTPAAAPAAAPAATTSAAAPTASAAGGATVPPPDPNSIAPGTNAMGPRDNRLMFGPGVVQEVYQPPEFSKWFEVGDPPFPANHAPSFVLPVSPERYIVQDGPNEGVIAPFTMVWKPHHPAIQHAYQTKAAKALQGQQQWPHWQYQAMSTASTAALHSGCLNCVYMNAKAPVGIYQVPTPKDKLG